MSDRYFHRIVVGETLLIEARFVGEDLGSAALRVTASGGLPVVGFELSKPSSDTVQILRSDTSDFAPGHYDLLLWFDRDGEALASEVAFTVRLSVGDV